MVFIFDVGRIKLNNNDQVPVCSNDLGLFPYPWCLVLELLANFLLHNKLAGATMYDIQFIPTVCWDSHCFVLLALNLMEHK